MHHSARFNQSMIHIKLETASNNGLSTEIYSHGSQNQTQTFSIFLWKLVSFRYKSFKHWKTTSGTFWCHVAFLGLGKMQDTKTFCSFLLRACCGRQTRLMEQIMCFMPDKRSQLAFRFFFLYDPHAFSSLYTLPKHLKLRQRYVIESCFSEPSSLEVFQKAGNMSNRINIA